MKPGHSRILTDENVSPRVVAFLRATGYDVSDIKELGLFGLPDREVLARAHAEQRIIITHDADFGMLAINQGVPFIAIIYIRLRNLSADTVIGVLDRFVKTEIDINNGMLVVIEEDRVRVRSI